MKHIALTIFFALAFIFNTQYTFSQPEPLGIAMENYDYPYPVSYMPFTIQGENVKMAYMDIQPNGASNGKSVMLLHGKNFFGAYWEKTINFLTENGFRVIVPDQIGFGKSSKPDIQYSFHLLADNTKKLLDAVGVSKVSVVGHSMGGMVAARFVLMYPEMTEKLVFENPIGLEDYKIKVPYTSIEDIYDGELNKTEQGIRNYHKSYYVEWKDEYEEYVQVHYRWTLGGEYNRLAWANALTSDMVYTQPVVYEFPNISVPTLIIIGQEDRTALGKDKVSEQVKATLGQYPELGRKTRDAIPGAKLVELDNVGHTPHFEATDRFHSELLNFLQ
jgi:pimeloyl-ACP methyl ester carboxylesterase